MFFWLFVLLHSLEIFLSIWMEIENMFSQIQVCESKTIGILIDCNGEKKRYVSISVLGK